ncbi:hypothetical protein HDV00_010122 [Rhizophlyctis rosea]|nr:hypothetical protein HDV00_010122 [Rhizophlyctis rosea]
MLATAESEDPYGTDDGGSDAARGSGSAPATPRSGLSTQKQIPEFFRRSNSSPQIGRANMYRGEGSKSNVKVDEQKVNGRSGRETPPDSESILNELKEREGRIKQLALENEQLQKQLTTSEQYGVQVKMELDEIAEQRESLKAELENAYRKAEVVERQTLEQMEKARQVLIKCLTAQAIEDARKARTRLHENSLRLATVSYERHGVDYHERWKEGYAFEQLQEQSLRITREREEVKEKSRLLKKRIKPSKSSQPDDKLLTPQHTGTPRPSLLENNTQTTTTRTQTRNGKEKEDAQTEPISSQEYHEFEEILQLRQTALKKEEQDLQAQLERLATERDLHIREARRIRDEDEVLHDRYLLLEMIGKGGFSEVYKAFDLVEMQQVACKIHSLSDRWSEERKKNYMKHSLREYHIHKELHHPRVVRLFDVFEYDYHSFCTILEFCEGRDLESHLQMVKHLPERDAKSIIMQVMSALKYLNERSCPIIHFDLKPVEDADPTTFGALPGNFRPKEMELTSQGAGTYWYLPPEVFGPRTSMEPIKISSKVDVWSLGCIFYELLYGIKPFSNDRSQQSILHESTIAKDAQHLTFPAPTKPAVSVETKDFIKRCLEYRKERRPDVLTL